MKNHVIPQAAFMVSYTTLFISMAVSSAISAGLAWYVRGRGRAGVKIDLDNVKTEVEALKNKISPPVVTSAPVQTIPAV